MSASLKINNELRHATERDSHQGSPDKRYTKISEKQKNNCVKHVAQIQQCDCDFFFFN